MASVKLFFETFTDSDISEHKIIRLKSGIQFKMKDGWTQPFSAIIDTGAHTSVIPLSIWKEIAYTKQGKHKIFGLSKKEECSLIGELAQVSLILIDDEASQTKELNAIAFLAETDQIPVILGFKGLLEHLRVAFDYQNELAYADDKHSQSGI